MNGSMKFFCMLLAVTALNGRALAADAVATSTVPPPVEHRRDFGFKAMDTDTNGTISLVEFKIAQEKRQEEMKKRMGEKFDASKFPNAEEIFKKLDLNADGALTAEEFRKSVPNRRRGEGEGVKAPRHGGDKKGAGAPAVVK